MYIYIYIDVDLYVYVCVCVCVYTFIHTCVCVFSKENIVGKSKGCFNTFMNDIPIEDVSVD
jgi:hypothetical protein